MKINSQPGHQGGALMLTLLTALVIGFTLASYLTLVSSQNASVMRSLSWNHAVSVAEAGVEEALTQLHHTGISNLLAHDWVLLDSGQYYKRRDLGANVYFEVGIKPLERPVIVSFGYVPAPLSPSTQVGMILGLTTPAPSTPPAVYLKRKVRVNAKRDPIFTKAMLAKGQINLNGNKVATDSFDSRDTSGSTNGKYDPAKARDHGDVATNSELIDSLDIGNANIKGKISTGPHGTVAVGSNGTVGSSDWVNGGNTGIQTGYVSDDMNIEFPDVELPEGNPISVTPGNYKVDNNPTNYNFVLSGSALGETYLSTQNLNGKIYVEGHVSLLVTSQLDIKGSDFIYLAPGASLKLYVGAASANLGGAGVSNTGSAQDFIYYGLNSNTSLSFGGNSSFTGSIYAPYAEFELNGSGGNTYDFVGASVTSTVEMNGHFNFHYDEALAGLFFKSYVVTAWNEMNPDSWD